MTEETMTTLNEGDRLPTVRGEVALTSTDYGSNHLTANHRRRDRIAIFTLTSRTPLICTQLFPWGNHFVSVSRFKMHEPTYRP